MKLSLRTLLTASAMCAAVVLAACAAPPPPPPPPPHHPGYLHALSDLRAARWMIEHRPGNVLQTEDEGEAVRQIDGAIADLKQAAIDDGKNIADHPPVDQYPDTRGRLHAAIEYLRKARADISHEEDNGFANGLRDRALRHIDAAIGATGHAIHE